MLTVDCTYRTGAYAGAQSINGRKLEGRREMRRFKQRLEGGAVALMAWALVGSGMLAVPNNANAIYGLPFPTLPTISPYWTYSQLDCQGYATISPSAREAYSLNPRSWSRSGQCTNDIFGLRSKAQFEWDVCNTSVRGGYAIFLVAIGTPAIVGPAALTATLVYKGAALVTLTVVSLDAATEWSMVREAVRLVCGRRPL